MRFFVLLVCFAAYSSLSANSSTPRSRVVTRLTDVLVSKSEVAKQQEKLTGQIREIVRKNNQQLLDRLRIFIEDEGTQQQFVERFNQISLEMEDSLRQRFDSDLGLADFLRNTTMDIYEREFTDEEMVLLGKFFTSTIGRKYLSLSSVIMEDLFAETQNVIVPRLLEIQAKVQEEYLPKFKELHGEYVEQ